jgi:hypothetical protein
MSELDDLLSEGRAAVATMGPSADLWERVVEHSNGGDAAVLDPSIVQRRRRPSLWLAAAVLALIALVGTIALFDDDQSIETVPADAPGTGPSTTEESRVISFAIPSSFELPDDWDLVEEDHSFYRLGIGPVSSLPQTKIEFAVPEEAATTDEAVAVLTAKAPSPFVFGDPIDIAIGQKSATCMDVEATVDGPHAPLLHFRATPDDEPSDDRELTLEEGSVGRVCVVDVSGFRDESPLIVLVQAPAAEFPAFLAEAEAVLADLEFS